MLDTRMVEATSATVRRFPRMNDVSGSANPLSPSLVWHTCNTCHMNNSVAYQDPSCTSGHGNKHT